MIMQMLCIGVLMVSCSSKINRTPLVLETGSDSVGSYHYCSKCSRKSIKTPKEKQSKDPVTFKSPTETKLVRIYFDRSKIRSSNLSSLKEILPSANERLIVSGYTDELGALSVNTRIAKERSNFIKNALIKEGVKKDRILVIARPLCCYLNNHSSEPLRALNRRVEVTKQIDILTFNHMEIL